MVHVVANLHNLKTNKYHPIFFNERPLPGHAYGESPIRLKSGGHHTDGFSEREDALINCKEIAGQLQATLDIEKDIPWNGEGIPAMVVFYADGKIISI